MIKIQAVISILFLSSGLLSDLESFAIHPPDGLPEQGKANSPFGYHANFSFGIRGNFSVPIRFPVGFVAYFDLDSLHMMQTGKLADADTSKPALSQVDTSKPAAKQLASNQSAKKNSDSSEVKKKVKEPHNPRKATIRSAILPGWGQVYNKKYWKVPIVYAALGVTGYVFFDNIKTYREVRFAYQVTESKDTASWDKVAPYLRVFVENNATSSLDNYRREFRRNIDYSVLVFLLFWGLNVVDATVDAHLKEFDVSPELSMKLKPLLPNNTYQLGVGNTTGLSLVFDIHKAKPAKLFAR
ncbi:DUF5683 domain-containing protein [Flavihumibacter sp. UBA7668]|uniref:DUF5683 domain-containing protein n=1 Tax=Flavihumibacter sp. UBA7668 TaxID=1946542 RepID=UPI0025C1DBDA|nr:DUF5683 domain-containing protein [Flavihumibacter sp. UBA7668]